MKQLFGDYMDACKEQKELIEELERECGNLSTDEFNKKIKEIGDLNEKISDCSEKIWGINLERIVKQ
jgi:hypothetical protein